MEFFLIYLIITLGAGAWFFECTKTGRKLADKLLSLNLFGELELED